jgi:hypothetical protein
MRIKATQCLKLTQTGFTTVPYTTLILGPITLAPAPFLRRETPTSRR